MFWNFESSIASHDLITVERVGGNKVPGTGLVAGTPKVVATLPHADGSAAWVLINDGRVVLVDVATGVVGETVQTRLNEATAFALSLDGRVLAVSGLEGLALLSTDGRQLLAVAGARGLAEDPSLSADGSQVAGSSGDLSFPMPYFDVETDGLRQTEVDFFLPLDQPFFAYDAARPILIRYSRGARVGLQDPDTLEPVVELDNSNNWSMGAVSWDDEYFLVGENWPDRHELTLYKVDRGVPIESYPLDDRVAFTGSIHPDGDRVIVAFFDGPPQMLSIPDLEPMEVPQDLGDIAGARWSGDGRWLFTIDRSRRVTLHDPVTFEPLRSLEGSRLTDHLTNLTVYSIDEGDLVL